MAINEENSLPSSHFFHIILSPESTQMKLPQRFLKEHENNLSKHAYLQVPSNGALTWKMEVKRHEGRVWLHKGWQEFVKYYSIKYGYFLVFRYEGGSKFRVLICDESTMEVQYPVEATTNDDEETDDGECSKKKTEHSESARDEVLQKAMAFKSPNPCFTVRMQPSYVSNEQSRLYIPQNARSHFLGKTDNAVCLNIEEDERAWFVNYFIGPPPMTRVRFSGPAWFIFVKENHVQVGDVCAFELVNSVTMTYKVTIFRVDDYATTTMEIQYPTIEYVSSSRGKVKLDQSKVVKLEEEDIDDSEEEDTDDSKVKEEEEDDEDDDYEVAGKSGERIIPFFTSARDKVLQRAKAFTSHNPCFIATMRNYHLSYQKSCLYVPQSHAKSQFLDKENNGIYLKNEEGRTWFVNYSIAAFYWRVRLSASGWRTFVQENHLEIGDVCVFELVNTDTMTYKVATFRVCDYAEQELV